MRVLPSLVKREPRLHRGRPPRVLNGPPRLVVWHQQLPGLPDDEPHERAADVFSARPLLVVWAEGVDQIVERLQHVVEPRRLTCVRVTSMLERHRLQHLPRTGRGFTAAWPQ